MRSRSMSTAGLFVLQACAVCAACSSPPPPPQIAGGNADRGRLLIEQYGCGTCHVVPGVRTATGRTGPPLSNFARSAYIAGELPNEPEVLIRWIQDPQRLVPKTAMPDLGVNEMHARDMSAWLYRLR